jgi:ribonuclease E
MPNSPDDPPSAPIVSVESEASSATTEEAPNGADLPGPSSQDGEAQPPRRRRRRRRRRPPLAEAGQTAAVADEFQSEEAPPASETAQHEPVGAEGPKPAPHRRRRRRRRSPHGVSQEGASQDGAPQEEASTVEKTGLPDSATAAPGEAPSQPEPSARAAGELARPRRHRRRPPHRTGPTGLDLGNQNRSGSEGLTEGTLQSAPGAGGRPRTGPQRHRRPGGPTEQEARPRRRGPWQPRDEDMRRGTAGARSPEQRDRGSDARGRRDRALRGRPPGRGREAPQRKPEQKLYALESIVDRGFEDVTDDTDESGTRRVHWTIIKRTVADQKSGKAMSAAYVLQREGVEAEFPNLGAARAAVNKTIVHPEKLTLSKAEHVAAKTSR